MKIECPHFAQFAVIKKEIGSKRSHLDESSESFYLCERCFFFRDPLSVSADLLRHKGNDRSEKAECVLGV